MGHAIPRVAALLAAGGGIRFSGGDGDRPHKLLALLRGRLVWEWSLEHLLDAGFDHVVIVTGALELPIPTSDRVIVVHNPLWRNGQAGSVGLAVHAAGELGARAVTIGLADQPFVTSADWRAVADAPPEARLVLARYEDGTGPNPVRLHIDVWPLLPADGDTGARDLFRRHPEWVFPVRCVGSGADIDTLEDLERWNNC